MYRVYWSEENIPDFCTFGDDEMSKALAFAQEMRNKQYAGERISFVVMAIEDPNMVGKQGYDVTGPDYDWKKRRI